MKEANKETLTIEAITTTKDTTTAIITMMTIEVIEADKAEMNEKTTRITEAEHEEEVPARTHITGYTKGTTTKN